MTRKEIRSSIFTILFRLDFTAPEEFSEQIDFAVEDLSEGRKFSDKDESYIRNKASDVAAKLADIDALIGANAQGWKIPRIGKAELTILRLAVYEMNYDEEVPVRVAINEAVELSKVYCDEEAKGFVNAVLGNIARVQQEGCQE